MTYLTFRIPKRIAKLVFEESPFQRYIRGLDRCRVPGCERYCPDRLLCRKHQGSPKFQHLAQL